MSLIEAFIFGLMQGLTEFLPVSSSAHVKLAKLFFNVESSEAQVIFDLVCHLGTLMALLYFLREEIVRIFLRDRRKLLLLFVATLPLVPCYFLLKPLRDFASHPQFLGFCLMLTGAILFLGQKWRVQKESVPATAMGPSSEVRDAESRDCVSKVNHKVSDVLWIGAMQSAALIPGVSRSASTISCARILGWDAKEAVRFSFLLSIPTIIGGNCLELLKVYLSHEKPPFVSMPACFVGLIISFAIGLFVIRFALSYLEKGNLKPFAWYCLGAGALVTVYLNFVKGVV